MTTRLLNLCSAPFIALLALPLGFFAMVTTSLAFGTLLLRVSVVYAELVISLLQSAISPSIPRPLHKHNPIPAHPPPGILDPALLRHHARRRTSSSGSFHSLANVAVAESTTNNQQQTPVSTNPYQQQRNGVTSGSATPGGSFLRRDASMASLLAGATTPRDYESVGGWRLTSDDAEDEALWMGINSRLELPALTIPSPRENMRFYTHGYGHGGSNLHASISAGLERLHAGNNGSGHKRSLTGSTFFTGNTRPQSRRGSVVGFVSAGSPELKPRSPTRHRRHRGSGANSPEGYFGSAAATTAAGLGMTAAATLDNKNGGKGGLSRSADVSRRGSRRGSVSLVKVRGE